MAKESIFQKSVFKTKNAAFIEGKKAYEKYQKSGCKIEAFMSYGDYLDYG